jgi:hypothetical protein
MVQGKEAGLTIDYGRPVICLQPALFCTLDTAPVAKNCSSRCRRTSIGQLGELTLVVLGSSMELALHARRRTNDSSRKCARPSPGGPIGDQERRSCGTYVGRRAHTIDDSGQLHADRTDRACLTGQEEHGRRGDRQLRGRRDVGDIV